MKAYDKMWTDVDSSSSNEDEVECQELEEIAIDQKCPLYQRRRQRFEKHISIINEDQS